MNENFAREEICRVGKSLFERGYAHATAGNISVRLDDGFLITPTDACLGFLDPARLARLDAQGRQTGGDKASKTLALHTRIYDSTRGFKAPPRCVLHTHSTYCVALTLQPQGERPLGACRAWGAESENRPQRGQFLPDLQAHSPAMGQKDGEKWTAAVGLQPAIPKSDRLLGSRLAASVFAQGSSETGGGPAFPQDELLPPITPYFVMKVGHVPVIPYHRPGDPRVAEQVAHTIARYADAGIALRAVMLERLGPNVWHETPAGAMATLEELEETARLFFNCRLVPDPLTVAELEDLRHHFGVSW